MSRDPFRDEPIFAMRDMTRIGDAAHDCFKDEIAIDFPSIGGLVERVRDARVIGAERGLEDLERAAGGLDAHPRGPSGFGSG